MSKGSSPRPFAVAPEEFANRFDAIFKKPKPAPEPDKEKQPEEEAKDERA